MPYSEKFNEEREQEATNVTTAPLNLTMEGQTSARQQENIQHEVTLVGECDTIPAPNTLRQAKSEEDCLDDVTFETFKPKQILKEKRPSSWTTIREPKMKESSSLSHEQGQCYDVITTTLKVHARATEESDSGLSPGYCVLQKEALTSPTESLYASLNYTTTSSTYDVPRKATSVYSIPHDGEKGDGHQHKEEKCWKMVKTTSEEILSSCLQHQYDFPTKKHKQKLITNEDQFTIPNNGETVHPHT